jgi:hypothetical protein
MKGYPEDQPDAPVDHGQGGDAPTSGNKPAGYDVALKMNGEAFDGHEIGSGWTPVGDDF